MIRTSVIMSNIYDYEFEDNLPLEDKICPGSAAMGKGL